MQFSILSVVLVSTTSNIFMQIMITVDNVQALHILHLEECFRALSQRKTPTSTGLHWVHSSYYCKVAA